MLFCKKLAWSLLVVSLFSYCMAASIEDYATIEAYVGEDEIPVYAFGYTYIYGQSPDLLDGIVMQKDNNNPITKLKLKKSWEIESNYCGSTPAREPKTMWNDDQPLLPVHLIDSDVLTSWSSRGMTAADLQKEWIRIDLAKETIIEEVALVGSSGGPGMNIGKSFPGHLTVKISTDGKDWQTVYDNSQYTPQKDGRNVISFKVAPAKMVWFIGDGFERVGNWGPAFSVAEVEVIDDKGNNVASIQRGGAVQVSTTYYGYGMDRYTQEMLWPVQYDLGFKWTRVGYDMGTYLWSYVEREKGKLQIDAKSDAAITDAYNNGVNVILCLDKGNWLYRNPPRKTDWKKSRVYEMMETYYDHQGWPHESDELMQGYLNYIDYMVRHFKDRVTYFEICNEWQQIGIDNYCKILNASVDTIKKVDPDAKIMLGSTGGFDRQAILQCLGAGSPSGIKNHALEIHGMHIVRPKNISAKNVMVTVDAQANAEAGIVLRFKDDRNFVLAIYSPPHQAIYFHERTDGNWGGMISPVHYDQLEPGIKLKASVEGNMAKFSVSDGQNTYETSHQIQAFHEAGDIGLFHNLVPEQRFDNFVAKDLSGMSLFEDDFNRPDETPKNWDMGDSAFVNPRKIAHLIDAIGWHPWYQADPSSHAYRHYAKDVIRLKELCELTGFTGAYIASEWTWMSPYPRPDTGELPADNWCSEMQKAKYSARLMTTHTCVSVVSLFNETFQSGRVERDCNLFRNTSFQVDPITPTQPQPIYYVLRNISTVLDGFEPSIFDVELSTDNDIECHTLQRNDDELMLTTWIPGRTTDDIVELESDITLSKLNIKQAFVLDVFNGTRQELNIKTKNNNTLIENIRIKDYPVFIQLIRK